MGINAVISDLWIQFKRKIPMWGREVMNRDIAQFLADLPRSQMDAIEISGWAHQHDGFRTWQALNYPGFDICTQGPIESRADIVFCEQVLEHVIDPYQGVRNLFSLLRPGGYAVISVPFFIRVHNEPSDYWRFTPAGLRVLIERTGFEIHRIGDWGNRAAALANFWFWCPRVPGLQPMWREKAVPLVVWAICQRPIL